MNNKHIGILWLLLLVVGIANAQVGINTTDPKRDLDVNGDMRVRKLERVHLDNLKEPHNNIISTTLSLTTSSTISITTEGIIVSPTMTYTPTIEDLWVMKKHNLTISPTSSYSNTKVTIQDKYMNVLVQSSNTGFVDRVSLADLNFSKGIHNNYLFTDIPVGGIDSTGSPTCYNKYLDLDNLSIGVQSCYHDVDISDSSSRKNKVRVFFSYDNDKSSFPKGKNKGHISVSIVYYEGFEGGFPSISKFAIEPGGYTKGEGRVIFQSDKTHDVANKSPFFYGVIRVDETFELYQFVVVFHSYPSFTRSDYFGRIFMYIEKY